MNTLAPNSNMLLRHELKLPPVPGRTLGGIILGFGLLIKTSTKLGTLMIMIWFWWHPAMAL